MPSGLDYPQTEDGMVQAIRDREEWAEQNPQARPEGAREPGSEGAEQPADAAATAEKPAEEAAAADAAGKPAAEAAPIPEALDAAFNADPALKAALDANPAARDLVMDMGRKYEAARPVLELIPTRADAEFVTTHANTMLDLRHNALLGIENPEARQGFLTGLKNQFVETDAKGQPVLDAKGQPVLGKDYDTCLRIPMATEMVTSVVAEMDATIGELQQKLKGYYPSEAEKNADQKRLDDLTDDREAAGWFGELLKMRAGGGEEKLPPLPADATPEQRKTQERLERQQAELNKQREAQGKGNQTAAVQRFEGEMRVGWQTAVGKQIDDYLAAAKERGEVISDYNLNEKWIDPKTKQAQNLPRLAVTILNDFDNTVMGITRERNEIQRLERLGPAGRQLREANAVRLRTTYLQPIIQKHIKAIQDGIRQSQKAEEARREKIGKVARVEPQSAATAGPQPNLTEAQIQEKALALVQKDPKWASADESERRMMLMTARTTVVYG
jgi:hypothetical protein